MDKKYRYAAIEKNDFINGVGVSVSFWTQGCPHRCPGCHNVDTWDFNGGVEDTLSNIKEKIDNAINANGVKRNFSILGGEPLCQENFLLTVILAAYVKETYPSRQIYLWTGYDFLKDFKNSVITEYVDVVIDGPYVEKERDITLPLRGSKNQRVLLKGIDF